MRLALVQTNPVVGDLDGNRALILERLAEGKRAGADLVVFPELAVTGYPPEDLLLRPGFIRAAEASLAEIARAAHGVVALVGTPCFDRDLYNACAVCADGEVKALVKKRFLPNYGVFDEFRYFAPGDELFLFEHGDTLVGVTVCEDMWQPGPPATDLALAGAQLLVNISASPFHLGKDREREEMFRTRARDTAAYVAFCNTVGGQDELIFDGHSLVLDDEGTVLARAPGFEEALLVVDVDPTAVVARRLTDARRRALARERGDLGAVRRVRLDPPRAQRDTVTPAIVPFGGRARADAAGARARAERLRAQERLRRHRRRRLRRHRLGADRGDRGRGARAGEGALRVDAVALLVRRHAHGRAPARGEPRLRVPRDRDRADGGGVRRRAGRVVRRTRAGPDGGEHPGADPRHRC